MAQIRVPEAPREYTTHYRQLLGVDFQSDQTEVSPRRSPEMVNMISDLGGNPIKRSGYRKIGTSYVGVASVNGDPWAVKKYSVGLRAFKLDTDELGNLIEPTLDEDIIRIDKSEHCGDVKQIFGAGGKLYILCSKAWYCYDTVNKTQLAIGVAEETMYTLSEDPDHEGEYIMTFDLPDKSLIPVVMTMYKPNGNEMVTLPEGTDITGATKGVNLLTPFRTIEYCVTTETANERKFVIPNTRRVASVIKVEVLDRNTYDWKEITSGFAIEEANTVYALKPDDPMQVANANLIYGNITFDDGSQPYIKIVENDEPYLAFRAMTSVRVPAGVPNVRITYAPFDTTLIPDEMPHAEQAAVMGFYKQMRSNIFNIQATEWFDARLFAAYKNACYYSRANAPFVIDDDFYFNVDDDILRLAKTSGALAVIGEDTGNSTIYLAKGEYNSTLAMPVYSVKTSNSGIGSVAPKVKGTMNDEPLLLANSGIYGLSTNYMSEKYTINRSGKIDRKLCKEANLSSAVGIEYNHYFYVAINGHMYVLDGRHRDTSKYGDSSYECYYFTGMPDIKQMFVINNRMYFEDDNFIYTWNDDLPEYCRYYDDLELDPETGDPSGKPVKARWCSLFDDDGAPQRLKTLMKKGTMALLLPYYNTGCEIYLVKDGDTWEYLGRFDSSITTFSYLDFIEVDFSSNVVSADVFTKKKMKKYKRLQFVLENNKPEPFGLVGVTKTYTFGNYAKR